MITIVLFEDNQCEALRPVGMFRPFYDVRIGSLTLHEMMQSLKIPVETIVRDLFHYEIRTFAYFRDKIVSEMYITAVQYFHVLLLLPLK